MLYLLCSIRAGAKSNWLPITANDAIPHSRHSSLAQKFNVLASCISKSLLLEYFLPKKCALEFYDDKISLRDKR